MLEGRVDVVMSSSDSPSERIVESLVVTGAEDEPFLLALGRALDNEVRGGTIEIRSTESDERLLAAVGVDREATMGEVSRFAGGETLRVSTIGRGGSRFVKLSEIVAAGVGLPDLAGVAALGHEALMSRVYARHRAEARHWLMRGIETAPEMPLVQLVKSDSYWSLADFQAIFALGDRDSADLLRRLNYEYIDRKQWGWQERPEA